ncbi:MAG: DUF5711 family protein [Clostridiales bacterium]|nr:DUF5711 family protein [Clostridiales bacterium]
MADNSQKNTQRVQKKRKEKLPRSVFWGRAFLVFLVLLMFIVIAAKSFANVTFSNIGDSISSYFESLGSGDGYPFSLNSISVKDIDMAGSDLLLLSDTKLTVLDKTAKQRSSIQHTFANPQMTSNNGLILVYDRGSTNFRLQTKKEVLFEKDIKEKITTADVGKKGNFAVATIGDTTKSVLTVYNSSFNEVFKWNSSSEYIIAVALSPNGKSVAVATVGAETGEIYTKISVFDFNKNDPVGTFLYSSTTIVDLIYTKRNVLVGIGDNLTAVIKNNTVKEADISYEAGSLSRYSYNSENGTFALFLSKFGSNSSGELRFYGSDASLVFSTDIQSSVRSIDCDSKYVCVLHDNNISYYNLKGKNMGQIPMKNDTQKIFIDGSNTYVSAVSEIRGFSARQAEKEKD